MGAGEAAAEVAGGRGVGQTAGPEGVEERFVVSAEVDVLQSGALAEGVVSEVEDVVGLAIRQVDLKHAEAVVDGLRQADPVDERMEDSDAAVDNGPVALRHGVIDRAGGEDRPAIGRAFRRIETAFDSGLASAEPRSEDNIHSESSSAYGSAGCVYIHRPRKPSGISSFLAFAEKKRVEITLG